MASDERSPNPTTDDLLDAAVEGLRQVETALASNESAASEVERLEAKRERLRAAVERLARSGSDTDR